MSSTSSSSSPWHSWHTELPSRSHSQAIPASESESLSQLYRNLNDESFLREMSTELRATLCSRMGELSPSVPRGSAVLVSGGTSEDFELYDSDTEKSEFRQESFFRYLFQINEPDCHAIIDLDRKEAILFVPFLDDDAERWTGTRRPASYYTTRYGVRETRFIRSAEGKEIEEVLKERKIGTLYTLFGRNLDSGACTKTEPKFPWMKDFSVNRSDIHRVLVRMRMLKTEREVQLLRWANLVTSRAHVYVMRNIRAGMVELQCESLFKAYCNYFGGSRHCAYTCICGAGGNGSVLHYGHAGRPNDRILQHGDSIVLDMGGEYQGYSTDVTRSYAISGKFTDDQRRIHNAVVAAQKAVMDVMKPGVKWPDMHRLAERVICEHLKDIGVLHNGTTEDFVSNHMGSVFMPHGLGHLMGLNVHDVGGYGEDEKKDPSPGVCWLRCGKALEEGMVITVEPGIYFNDPTLDKAIANPNQSKFINESVLSRFRGSGGCRIEDDVVVTKTGCENFTILPTTAEEIEEVMQKK